MDRLKHYWHAVLGSHRLEDRPVGVKLLGESVVVFRDGAGRARALEGRCPHRGYPLSLGERGESGLRCALHGWEFAGSGQCLAIPSDVDSIGARSVRARAFGCVERDGFVWVDLSASLQGPPVQSRNIGPTWLQGHVEIAADFSRALELTMDLAHIPFAHPAHPMALAFRRRGLKPSHGNLAPDATGFTLSWRRVRIRYEIPATIVFEITGSSDPYLFVFHTAPVDQDKCRIEWAASNPGGREYGAVPVSSAQVIEEDKLILETLAALPPSREAHCEADLPALMLRKILNWVRAGEWPEKLSLLEAREVRMNLPDLAELEPVRPTEIDPHLRLIHQMME